MVALPNIFQCLSQESGGRNCKLLKPRGHRLALALLDFIASASACQAKGGVKTARCEETPWAPPGLAALGSDLVVIEVDVRDGLL